jgi:porphobilinogen synthase
MTVSYLTMPRDSARVFGYFGGMESFVTARPRRLRTTAWMRDLVQEHRLHASDLILPAFVQEGEELETLVDGLPGVHRRSIDALVQHAREAARLGIPAIALFPVIAPEKKTPCGKEAFNPENLMNRAVRTLKREVPEIGIIADVALDPYTTHGHDGVLDHHGDVANDATLAALCKQALCLAEAGADMVAPSAMMDGQVHAIRHALCGAGHSHTGILAYSVKYASAFYGPFRAAVGSKNALGGADKRTYQMQPANALEALREAALDEAEGADMLMVKPGLIYLDVLSKVAVHTQLPVIAYHVSGEYAMLKAAASQGMLEEMPALLETMLAFKRAGARAVITYGAMELARVLGGESEETR